MNINRTQTAPGKSNDEPACSTYAKAPESSAYCSCHPGVKVYAVQIAKEIIGRLHKIQHQVKHSQSACSTMRGMAGIIYL